MVENETKPVIEEEIEKIVARLKNEDIFVEEALFIPYTIETIAEERGIEELSLDTVVYGYEREDAEEYEDLIEAAQIKIIPAIKISGIIDHYIIDDNMRNLVYDFRDALEENQVKMRELLMQGGYIWHALDVDCYCPKSELSDNMLWDGIIFSTIRYIKKGREKEAGLIFDRFKDFIKKDSNSESFQLKYKIYLDIIPKELRETVEPTTEKDENIDFTLDPE